MRKTPDKDERTTESYFAKSIELASDTQAVHHYNSRRHHESQLHWQDILKLVGQPAIPTSLPSKITCPFCSDKRLHLYSQPAGGAWYYCFGCESRGDLIMFASKCWGLSIRATMVKLYSLIQNGDYISQLAGDWADPKRLASYEQWFLGRLIRAEKLWLEAQQRYPGPDETIINLQRRLRLNVPRLSRDRWQAAVSDLIGSHRRDDAENAFFPRSADFGKGGICGNPSTDRLFRGRGWGEVMVLPYYSLPGFPSGFVFVGRDGQRFTDFVYRRIHLPVTKQADFGLHGLHTTWKNDGNFNDFVLAVDDPLTAMQMQFKHSMLSNRPLPIVAWHGAVPTNAWQALQGRKVIFWSSSVDAALLNQAMHSNGKLAICGPSRQSWTSIVEYLQDRRPEDLLRLFSDNARDWPEAVALHMQRLPEQELEELLLQFKAANFDIRDIVRSCSKETRNRIRELNPQERTQWHGVEFRGRRVNEVPKGWIRENLDKKKVSTWLTDAPFRIQEILTTPQGLIYYRGVIRYRGNDHHFCEQQKVMEHDSRQWLKDFLLRRGVGMPRIDPSVGPSTLLKLSLALHEPVVVQVTNRAGWQEDSQSFRLPNFEIDKKGNCKTGSQLLPGLGLPGTRLQLDTDPRLSTMPNNVESQVFWATITAVLSNIVAPAMRKPTVGIGLGGPWADSLGKFIAEACGCYTATMKDIRKDRLESLEKRHNWPLFVSSSTRKEFRDWLQTTGPLNRVVSIAENDGLSLQVRSRWRTVTCPQDLSVAVWMVEEARRIVPAYLAQLARGGLALTGKGHWVRSLNENLAKWVDACGGDPDIVRTGMTYLQLDTRHSAGSAFMEWLARAKLAGTFTVREAAYYEFDEYRHGVIYDTDECQGLLVTQQALQLLCRRCGIAPFASTSVTRSLRAAEHLVKVNTTEQMARWLIDLKAWNIYVRDLTIKARSLRIVG